jgi:hypothetical protein
MTASHSRGGSGFATSSPHDGSTNLAPSRRLFLHLFVGMPTRKPIRPLEVLAVGRAGNVLRSQSPSDVNEYWQAHPPSDRSPTLARFGGALFLWSCGLCETNFASRRSIGGFAADALECRLDAPLPDSGVRSACPCDITSRSAGTAMGKHARQKSEIIRGDNQHGHTLEFDEGIEIYFDGKIVQ